MDRTHNIFIFMLFLTLQTFEIGGGTILEETYLKWVQYKDDCIKMIINEPFPQGGLFCNRSFDRYACWPDTPAGSVINISCPFYLPWYSKVSQGVVRRHCGADGLWEREDSGQVWRDMTQCEEEKEVTTQELWFKELMVSFKILYTVGYSLSLFSLITALIILLSFRRLHCTRNYIHANLFLSFILRAVSVIVKDSMLERHWGREIMQLSDVREILSHQAALGCRIAQVLMQYCVLANHYWFFGEAFYLYTVLIASVFMDNNKNFPYICLGWGTPLLFVVPWGVMKLLKENTECWAINENYWWIIRFPIIFASLINFLIFVKILKVIFSKLRASNQTGYPDYKLRLAKTTLTLLPLFGVHEVIFIFATDKQITGILHFIKVFFSLFLNSFQGFLVSVLYCYANEEVRTELKRKLHTLRTEAVCCGQYLDMFDSRVETLSIAMVPDRNRSSAKMTRAMADGTFTPDSLLIFRHQVRPTSPQPFLQGPSAVNRDNNLPCEDQDEAGQPSAAVQVSILVHDQDPAYLLPNVVDIH